MNRQLLLDVLPAPAPSLNNFIAGPNGEALAAARALAAGRAIYLWGPAGCGRSHLLRGLASRAEAVYIDAPSGPQMLRQLAQADSTAPMPAIIAVDDVHLMDKARQAALFALYNRWRESAATDRAFALAVAGDRAPMSLPLREDLRTRLGWDLAVSPRTSFGCRQAVRAVGPGRRPRPAIGARGHQLDVDAPRARHPQAGRAA